MKIFGREPALIVGVIVAGVSLLGTLGFTFLGPDQAGAWIAAINALAAGIMAWTTRPLSPGVYTYIVSAFAALGLAYGLEFTDAQVNAVNGFLIGVLTLVTRNQVSPVTTAVTQPSLDPTVEAARKEGSSVKTTA